MNNGLCITSIGNECFEKYAYNLAVSIKVKDPHVKIALLTDKLELRALTEEKVKIFDSIITISPSQLIFLGKPNICRLKLLTYKLSPFDFTIYIDSNCLWISDTKISDLFEKFKNDSVILQHNHSINLKETSIICKYSGGVDALKLFEPPMEFNSSIIHEFHGQFMMFKRGNHSEIFFDKCLELYDNISFGKIKFNHHWNIHGYITDELCTTLASAMVSIPFVTGFFPVAYQTVPLNETKNFYLIKINGMDTKKDVIGKTSYCEDENKTKSYIDLYNTYIKNINNQNNYECFNYPKRCYTYELCTLK